jgi:hypothetical protein
MMDQGKKAQWVAALRSGEYRQGRGHLKKNTDGENFYCCLGVLCEIALQDGLPLREHVGGNGATFFNGDDSFLPSEIAQWAKLPNDNPSTSLRTIENVEENATLSYLNDTGKSFLEIADIIEREF